MHFFKLIRLYNLLILALTQMIGRVFLIGPYEKWPELLLEKELWVLISSTICIAAAGYIINDYYDVKIDTINKPDRVVIDRTMRRRDALFLQYLLNLIGISLGFLVHWKLAAANAFCAFLLWAYSNRLKRIPLLGNTTIAFLSSVSLLLLIPIYESNSVLVFTFALFAFVLSLVREIIKDMEDIKGDARFGARTLPIIWGFRKTKILLHLLIIVLLFSIVILLYDVQRNILIFHSIFVFPLLFVLLIAIYKADKKRQFGRLSTFTKVIMLIGVISMIVNIYPLL